MRGKVLLLCWAFIAAAAWYDSAFAWHYREGFAAWEMNPLARWLEHGLGLWSVFALKFAGLLLSAGLAYFCYVRRLRLEQPLTYSIGAAYALLSLRYLLAN